MAAPASPSLLGGFEQALADEKAKVDALRKKAGSSRRQPPGPVGPTTHPAPPGLVGTTTDSATFTPVTDGPPVPALQAIGFNGGVKSFNQRLDAVYDAHVQRWGYPPGPGLALDFAGKSTIPAEQFLPIFMSANKSAAEKRTRDAVAAAGGAPETFASHAALLDGVRKAQADGTWSTFAAQHAADLDVLSKNPMWAARLAAIVQPSPAVETRRSAEAALSSPDATAVSVFGRAVSQIVGSLPHIPAAVYQIALAADKDASGAFFGTDTSFSHTRAIGGAVVEGTKQDFEHPKDRPGFLLLDLLGVASLGSGTVARLSAVGRVEGLGAKVAAAVAKPRGGTVQIGREGATEQALVSDNTLVAFVQRKILDHRQEGLEERVVGEEPPPELVDPFEQGVPAGLRMALLPRFAEDWLARNFSIESKVGREASARQRIEHNVAMTQARQLDHVTGHGTGLLTASEVYARMPAVLRNRLTRGENKAIQTVSFGVSPEDQIVFHRQMIDAEIGDPAAHQRQIADLELAKTVLGSSSPGKDFSEALALTRAVIAETERLKVDVLGLSPVKAAERVGKPAAVIADPVTVARRNQLEATVKKLSGIARTQALRPEGVDADLAAGLERAQAELDGLANPLTDTATPGPQDYPATGEVEPFYTKLEPIGKQRRGPSDRGGFFASRPGPLGEGPPRTLPELTHEFTGKAIIAGDFRIDASALASQGFARTVRAATVLAEHDKHWAAGTETPRSQFDLPVRDRHAISDELRTKLADLVDGAILPEEAEGLPEDMRTLLDELYVTGFENKYGPLSAITEPIEGVRFFDSRMIGSASKVQPQAGGLMKAFEVINEPARDATLFLRPAYAVNLLGNVGMLTFDEGFAAVPNIAWALGAKSRLGEEAYRAAVTLTGGGRSGSYATALTPRVGRVLAQSWNTLTDQVFRIAALRHYARALGVKTDEQLADLLKTGGPKLEEITRRANKSMVEFDNLTAVEKGTLRHIIFVYPWVRGSTVWSLRSIMEHPAKVDVLAHLGEEEANSDPLFKHVPSWFKRAGYFAVGWNDDGTPKVVNGTSVNTFSTLSDLLSIAQAGTSGSQYASVADTLGPAASFAIHMTTGRDEYGNRYQGSQVWGAARESFLQLPQVSAFERGQKPNPPLKPFNVTDRASLQARLDSALKRTVLSPGWLNGWGSIIAGGFSPRGEDPLAAEARYWRDQPAEARHQRELDLLNRALTLQGAVLKQRVPAEVRSAVEDAANVSLAFSQYASDHGNTPGPKVQAGIWIDYLAGNGRISPAEAKTLHSQLLPILADNEIAAFTKGVVSKYGHGKKLAEWDRDVRLVASFKPDVFAQKAALLEKAGLVPTTVGRPNQKALYEYGRQYLAYTKQAAAIQAEIDAGKATTDDLRVFQDKHDVPVSPRPKLLMLPGDTPGLVDAGNIDINNRQVAHNPDGSISTVRTISIGTDKGETLIPTVINGKVVSDKAAIAYYDRTGQNLGTFKSVAAANAYSVKLHNQQAKVYANGTAALPSFARLSWAYLSPQEQQKQLHADAAASWKTLSAFDKTLLGVKTAPTVTAGWAAYDATVSKYHENPDAPGLVIEQKAALAKQIDRDHPGFYRDFTLAAQPRIVRFEQTSVYKRMAGKALFEEFIAGPAKENAAQEAANGNPGYYAAHWHQYVTEQIDPWLAKHPALRKEIDMYPSTFLDGLVAAGA